MSTDSTTLKTRDTLPPQHKGLTVQPVTGVYPTVGESPSGPYTSHFGDAAKGNQEEERTLWEGRRTAAAEARAAVAEGDEEDAEAEDGEIAQPAADAAGSAHAQPPIGEAPPPGPHALNSGWALWEHRANDGRSQSYEANMAKLVEFATIEDFWRAWNNVPKPSAVFFDGKASKKVGDRVIESFSLFKAGIKPEWEDKANRAGGEWFIRKSLPLPYLDEVWLKLVLGMIGETLDDANEITGARVCDKSSRGKPMYRLELWFRNKAAMDPLKNALHAALNDPKKPFVWESRYHS
jgi:hypothetical protein